MSALRRVGPVLLNFTLGVLIRGITKFDKVANAFSKHFQSIYNQTPPGLVQSLSSRHNNTGTAAFVNDNVAGFEFLTVVVIKNSAFWDKTPYSVLKVRWLSTDYTVLYPRSQSSSMMVVYIKLSSYCGQQNL
jgi:hypothetical protein